MVMTPEEALRLANEDAQPQDYKGGGFVHDLGTGVIAGGAEMLGGIAHLDRQIAGTVLDNDNPYMRVMGSVADALHKKAEALKSDTLGSEIGQAIPKMVAALHPAGAVAEAFGLTGAGEQQQEDRGQDPSLLRAAVGAGTETLANAIPLARLFRPASLLQGLAADAAVNAGVGAMAQGGANYSAGRPITDNMAEAAGMGAMMGGGLRLGAEGVGAAARGMQGLAERAGTLGGSPRAAGALDAVDSFTGNNQHGFSRQQLAGNADELREGLSSIQQDQANVKQLYGDEAPAVPFNAADVADAADRPNLAGAVQARFDQDVNAAQAYKDHQYQKQQQLAELIRDDGNGMSLGEASRHVAKQIGEEKNQIWNMRQQLQDNVRSDAGDLPLSEGGKQAMAGWMESLRELASDYANSDRPHETRAVKTINAFRKEARNATTLWDLHNIETGLLNNSDVYKTLTPEQYGFLRNNLETIYTAPDGIVSASPQQLQQFNAYRKAIGQLYKERVQPLNEFSKQMDAGGDDFIKKLHTALTTGANGEALAGLTYINDDTLKILASYQFRGAREHGSLASQGKNLKTLGSTFENAAQAQARQLQATLSKLQSDQVVNGLLQKVGAIDHFQQKANQMLSIASKGALYKSVGNEVSRGISAGQMAENEAANAASSAVPFVNGIKSLARFARQSLNKSGEDIAKAESDAIYKQLLGHVDSDLNKAAQTGDYAKHGGNALKRLQYIAALSKLAKRVKSIPRINVISGYNEKPETLTPQRLEKPSNNVPEYLQRPDMP